ncbi:hypothetical protein Q3H58_004271 [Pseudomonas psychrotolerans]|nr:hypothetical protein [Pseudomonas psychrotolerans]
MSQSQTLSREPSADPAEHEAFFPSPYSLSLYTSPKTDFAGADYPAPYQGPLKVLMIATDERYLEMQNGRFFSTGNHPVEMLLPMYHLDLAGFEIEVVTLSGNPAKLEMWAMPGEDQAVASVYRKYLPQLRAPKRLDEVLDAALGEASPYLAVFVPGGPWRTQRHSRKPGGRSVAGALRQSGRALHHHPLSWTGLPAGQCPFGGQLSLRRLRDLRLPRQPGHRCQPGDRLHARTAALVGG